MAWRLPGSLLLLALLVACNRSVADSPVTAEQRAAAERFIGAPFPATATELYLFQEVGIDERYLIRFDAPPASVAAFTAELGLDSSLQDGFNPFAGQGEAALDWWMVEAVEQFIGASELIETGKGYDILIDTSDNGLYRVYLQAYST